MLGIALVISGCWTSFLMVIFTFKSAKEGFNDWGGRGYDDFVPEEVTKTASSGDETT